MKLEFSFFMFMFVVGGLKYVDWRVDGLRKGVFEKIREHKEEVTEGLVREAILSREGGLVGNNEIFLLKMEEGFVGVLSLGILTFVKSAVEYMS